MTCTDCKPIEPFTGGYNMHCAGCVRRWIKTLSSQEHKQMVIDGLKDRFLKKGE